MDKTGVCKSNQGTQFKISIVCVSTDFICRERKGTSGLDVVKGKVTSGVMVWSKGWHAHS